MTSKAYNQPGRTKQTHNKTLKRSLITMRSFFLISVLLSLVLNLKGERCFEQAITLHSQTDPPSNP